ncbi:YajG family lipoprotein [Thioalkalivibrio sp. ALJ1]|uniref:YajG family lipoprotein n=1 Tax=Thioalkalivibrio sp. ALJ1 TaxID=1158144 RepID=UPI00056ECFA7|nr:YajG family lipoprotein [Thioalkalivibrio sp. ALJ1]
MIIGRLAGLVLGGLFLAGCTTTPVTLDPASSRDAAVAGEANVEMGAVTDSRQHGSNWLGAIRGGFGNPLQTLETEKPVSEVVREQFITGLEQRGMLAQEGEGDFILEVDIEQLDSNQVMRREAHSRLDVALIEQGSSQVAYENSVRSSNVEGGAGGGVFASIEKLEEILTRTLWETIDEALDDERLHQAIADGPAEAQPSSELEVDIEALRRLRDRGVITEDEYRERVLQLVD